MGKDGLNLDSPGYCRGSIELWICICNVMEIYPHGYEYGYIGLWLWICMVVDVDPSLAINIDPHVFGHGSKGVWMWIHRVVDMDLHGYGCRSEKL